MTWCMLSHTPGRITTAKERAKQALLSWALNTVPVHAVTRLECLAEEGAKQAARLGALDARHFGGADLQRGAQRA